MVFGFKSYRLRSQSWIICGMIALLSLTSQANSTVCSIQSLNGPLETIQRFFNHLNNRNFGLAFELTDNDLWQPLSKFSTGVWGDFEDIDMIESRPKNYSSVYGGEAILEVTYFAFDRGKNHRQKYTYDFHLRQDQDEWKIVRMIHPREFHEKDWITSDPMYKPGDLEMIRLLNRPFCILQDYYDLFANSFDVKTKVADFYYDALIIHHNDILISSQEAANKDFNDFVKNNIRSYQILVQAYGMLTNLYESFDIVHVPLNYYVEKMNGQRSHFTINISAVLNKENTKILAIGTNIDYDRVHEILSALNKDEQSESLVRQNRNPIANPYHGDLPYEYCYGPNSTCNNNCSEIKVKMSRDADLIVILKQNGEVVSHAFVRAGGTHSFSLRNGFYQPFFYSGKDWDPNVYIKEVECGSLYGGFTSNISFSKDVPQKLYNAILTYELILQPNGNFNTRSSSKAEAF